MSGCDSYPGGIPPADVWRAICWHLTAQNRGVLVPGAIGDSIVWRLSNYSAGHFYVLVDGDHFLTVYEVSGHTLVPDHGYLLRGPEWLYVIEAVDRDVRVDLFEGSEDAFVNDLIRWKLLSAEG